MSKINIFLILPPIFMKGVYYPDVEPGYIKSYVEKHRPDVKVTLFDLNLVSEDYLFEQLKRVQPKFVGVTCFSPNRFASIDLAEKIRQTFPEIMIVFRGNHASTLYEQVLENYSWVDLVVRGESEETFVELVDHVGGEKSLKEIAGICFRDQGKIIAAQKRPFLEDLDELPFPEHVEYSVHYRGQDLKAAQIVTSRGCSNGCRFCVAPPFLGNARYRSAKNVVDELTIMVNDYGVEYVHFRDDTFTEKPELVHEICDRIKERGLQFKWQVLTRANTLDELMLRAMKDAGCVQVGLGVESGNQDILDRMNKKTSIRQIVDVSRMIKEVGIDLHVCLMVGNPGETKATVKDTKALIRKIKPDSYSISRGMYLLPGTSFAIEFQQKGTYSDAQWLDRSVHYVKYLAEHTEEVLAKWHLSLVITCWLQLPIKRKFAYVRTMLKMFGPAKLFEFVKPSAMAGARATTSPDSL